MPISADWGIEGASQRRWFPDVIHLQRISVIMMFHGRVCF